MLACLHKLLFTGHAKQIYLMSRSLPPPLTRATEADEGRSPCGCTPLPEITVGWWLWRSCEQPRVTPDKWPEWRTWARMLFVTSRQQRWNATGIWEKLWWDFSWGGLRDDHKEQDKQAWRASQCQDFLIPQSQHDTRRTSLAFGQDLWWNRSPPAGTLLVCAACHYPTLHCSKRNQPADKGIITAFIIISSKTDTGADSGSLLLGYQILFSCPSWSLEPGHCPPPVSPASWTRIGSNRRFWRRWLQGILLVAIKPFSIHQYKLLYFKPLQILSGKGLLTHSTFPLKMPQVSLFP